VARVAPAVSKEFAGVFSVISRPKRPASGVLAASRWSEGFGCPRCGHQRAHRWCPSAHIHAFEIVPETFSTLQRRSSSSPAVRLNPIGLAEQSDRVEVIHCLDDSGLSSVIPWPHGKRSTTLSGEVVTGDDYCADHHIDHIDFLKLNIEGAELPALRGFRRMLSAGSIDVIQFEYGYVYILPKFLLKDIVEFLTAHGFVVGKMFPTYVDFKPYDLKDEDFMGPNYCAVRQSRQDLIALLA
jgi:FkbM family methyltransferase